MSTDEASKEDGGDASHTDEIIKAVEDCNFIIIDSVGNSRILNVSLPDVESVQDSQDDELEVVFSKDRSGLFCLDTTPQAEKEKEKATKPRFLKDFREPLQEISDCPVSRAQAVESRALGFKNQPKFKNRYHVDEKPDKFSHLKPGAISESLRDALGLRLYDVPLHVYQMRLLGYPPGWLEKITEQPSGLDFVDTPNKSTLVGYNEKVAFDLSGIVDFPGFNAPLEQRYRDFSRALNFPPQQYSHSKEELIKKLNNRMLQTKIRFRSPEPKSRKKSVPNAEPEELEELLSVPGETYFSEESQESTEITALPLKVEDTISLKSAVIQSKLLAMGTPVSIRYSPYNSLPNLNKFAINMGDLELFKNLPNSTGAFQKVKSLLKKMKSGRGSGLGNSLGTLENVSNSSIVIKKEKSKEKKKKKKSKSTKKSK